MIPDEWADLQPGEPVERLRHVGGSLWTAVAPAGWSALCRWASCHLGGQWWPRDHGLTWSLGSRHAWLVPADQVDGILAARSICEGLGVPCGWSIGSCARGLLKWYGPRQWAYRSSYGLLADARHGYLECHPGSYEYAWVWDVKGYYYDLLTRLPTWRLVVRGNRRLLWGRESPQERLRRDAILRAVAGHKLLRNALVGCMQGRERGSVYFHKGNRCLHPGGPGPFLGAGLLVVRSGWELARRAAVESDSVLSQTDCVWTATGAFPSVWSDLGFRVELRAEGAAEVCSPVVFRIGRRQSEYYRRGSRFVEEFPRPAPPTVEYAPLWVRSPAA